TATATTSIHRLLLILVRCLRACGPPGQRVARSGGPRGGRRRQRLVERAAERLGDEPEVLARRGERRRDRDARAQRAHDHAVVARAPEGLLHDARLELERGEQTDAAA